MYFRGRGTYIARDICLLGWGTHITRYITRDDIRLMLDFRLLMMYVA